MSIKDGEPIGLHEKTRSLRCITNKMILLDQFLYFISWYYLIHLLWMLSCLGETEGPERKRHCSITITWSLLLLLASFFSRFCHILKMNIQHFWLFILCRKRLMLTVILSILSSAIEQVQRVENRKWQS